jgi:hypothetical protein
MITTICLESARDGLHAYELVLELLPSSHPPLQSQHPTVNNERPIASVTGHLPTFSRLLLLDETVDFRWWVQNEVVLDFRGAWCVVWDSFALPPWRWWGEASS